MKLKRLLFSVAFLCMAVIVLPACKESLRAQSSRYDEWNKPFKPFRIIGNIHYVGTNNLACYLITTSSGHILLDTAMQESGQIVRGNIEALGFKLKDIKIILSSHSHFDHVAGHADMKAATGAQVYATGPDAITLESGGTKGFRTFSPYKPVKVDKILKDGEVVRLGDAALKVNLTPGHTEGNTTWTTTITDGGKKYDVVFVGSMSINPGVHMVNFPAWPGIAEAYAKSFQILKSLPCDVFLGPHAPFFNMEDKVKRMNAKSNPFIDPEGYRAWVAANEKSYLEQLQREQKSAGK